MSNDCRVDDSRTAIAMSASTSMIQCREKQLPHYFGRLLHALDIFKHAENEGQWNQVRPFMSKLENDRQNRNN